MLTVEGGDAEMTQQKNSRKGSAVWPMVLSWLSSLILALLAVFVMLFTTFGNVGYMQSCVKSSGYAQSAYDDMVQDFISYGKRHAGCCGGAVCQNADLLYPR